MGCSRDSNPSKKSVIVWIFNLGLWLFYSFLSNQLMVNVTCNLMRILVVFVDVMLPVVWICVCLWAFCLLWSLCFTVDTSFCWV